MKLEFIGEDGSMGLRHGEVYECHVVSCAPYVYVFWYVDQKYMRKCPYSSLKTLLQNWEEV